MAKKSVCLYFQVHQPTRLRLYRFFDMGKDSHYYDDFANRTILRRIAQKCYLPMNALLQELVDKYGEDFKVCFSLSGSVIEQFDRYAPEVLESFRRLAKSGSVEFLSETYYHSLAAIANPSEFKAQVVKHRATIEQYFGVTPTAFRNTELIYSNTIGEMVYDLGFTTMLTEGARHIMGWRSPNFVYRDETQPKLKLLLRNYALSDDIAFRFGGNSLTAESFLGSMKGSVADGGDTINLFMDYETFGEHQKAASGIFDFIRALVPAVIEDGEFAFRTPSEVVKKHRSVSEIDVPETISWADEERDVTAWLGNELQQDAFNKLYAQYEKLAVINDIAFWNDFGHLQESDHFYYMCTKFFSDGEVHKYFNPYDNPYEAFINYMNVLSDFIIRIDDEISVRDTKFVAPRIEEEMSPLEAARKAQAIKKQAMAASKKATSKKVSTATAKKAPAKKAPAKKAAK